MNSLPPDRSGPPIPAPDPQSLTGRTLVALAAARGPEAERACSALLAVFAAGRVLRHSFQRALGGRLELNENQFATLITLHASDANGLSPAELAAHAEVTRAAMTDIADHAEARGWIVRNRDENNRRNLRIQLTSLGREKAVQALQIAVNGLLFAAGGLTPEQAETLREGCARLAARARELPASVAAGSLSEPPLKAQP